MKIKFNTPIKRGGLISFVLMSVLLAVVLTLSMNDFNSSKAACIRRCNYQFYEFLLKNDHFLISLTIWIASLLSILGVIDKVIFWIKTGKTKTTHPKSERNKTFKLSPYLKRWFYAISLSAVWLAIFFLEKREFISLSAIHFALIAGIWLIIFIRDTGLNGKGQVGREIREDKDKKALLSVYNITKNKDTTYSYSGKIYKDLDSVINAARKDKLEE